jgi:hypothetical protein
MPSRTVLALLAFAFAGSAALAQDAPPPPAPQGAMPHMMHMNKDFMAKHRVEMCDGLYARAVGRMAELEVKLALTATQKPLFERWKAVRLASVKMRSGQCAKLELPGPDAAILDGLKLETAMLEARLADLKAETPSLEALVKALDPGQQKTLQRAARRLMHERMDMLEHMHGMRDRSMRMFHRNGDMAPPPPEATEPPQP